jgi:peptidoglycan hydrolase-like protein with peptidoglycan-binding domain
MRLAGAAILCLLAALPALAQAPKPAKAPKAAPAAPVPPAYAAVPVAERIAIQNDLIWVGAYNGTATPEFGPRAVAAVKAYQKDNGGKETGVLGAPERAALAAAAKARQEAVGWNMLNDAATGARLGLPLKLVPQAGPAKAGSRFASGRGEVQIETFRIAEPDTTLAAVFEQQKKEPAGRQVDYNVLRPDFFVISGLQNLKKFYVRAHAKDGEVRGITILYDQAMEGIMDPVVVAMSSAFMPFPTGALAGPVPRRKIEYATGIVVTAAGDIVTDREATEGCYVIAVGGLGNAERIADDKDAGLALLRVYGAPELHPLAFASGVPAAPDVTVVGVADPQAQGGGDAASNVRARLGSGADAARPIEPAPAWGFSGAAVLDAQGRLAGMVVLKAPVVAGPAPSGAQAAMVPGETIRRFLERANVAPVSSGATGLEAAKAAVVRVICARK